MNKEFEKDMSKAYQFYEKNKAQINQIFKENKLFNIEFDDNQLARLFDMYAGIDYIAYNIRHKSMFGVASRINFNPKHHKFVTIRYKRTSGAKTEFEKRLKSILQDNSSIYASITMQIDALERKNDKENHNLIRAIVFESDKLYLAINDNISFFENKYMETNHSDGNSFFRLPHSLIEEIGKQRDFRVKVVEFE